MTDAEIAPFLKKLISAPGLSGYESPVRAIIEENWSPLCDEMSVSRLGSLHALLRGTAPDPRPSILLAAHMDAIGLMVTRVSGEFLYITDIGGVDARVLPGTTVTVYGREEIRGLVVQEPSRLLPEKYAEAPVPLEYLIVDTGLPASRLQRLVRIGDLVSFATQPVETADQTLSGHSLDNRASIAALTVCMQALKTRPHPWDVWAVATTQEETVLGGAMTSAFHLQPDLAVAVDVTFAAGPGASGYKTFGLGKGPTLGLGPNIHPALYKAFKATADRLEMPYQTEAMPKMSGTDAIAMQVAREGIPCMVVSIPLRYMHTPVEMVSLRDIERTGRLLAEFIAGLAPDMMEKITWED